MTTSERATDLDAEQATRLLTTTRAVRRRLDLDRPVDRSTVLDCVRIACQAPTGSNAQKWRWLIVEEPAKRKRIGDLYRQAYEQYLGEKSDALRHADTTTLRVGRSSQYLADHLGDVPVLAIPCILGRLQRDATAREMASFWGGVLPAVWSFQLALRSRGLGSAWTTLHLDHEDEIAELLGIPPTVTQAALLPVAHYQGTTFQPAQRRPVEELTYWNEWKRTDLRRDS